MRMFLKVKESEEKVRREGERLWFQAIVSGALRPSFSLQSLPRVQQDFLHIYLLDTFPDSVSTGADSALELSGINAPFLWLPVDV